MCADADWCDGPDSEEVIGGVVQSHGHRGAVAAIRAALRGNVEALRGEVVAEHVNTTLLSAQDALGCLAKVYEGVGGPFPEHSPAQNEPYDVPQQWALGDAAEPNELFPWGEYDEPERGFDALWWPPLLWAARNQDARTCRALVELGADTGYVSPAGMTAVLAALRGGDVLYDAAAGERCAEVIRAVATPETLNYLPPEAREAVNAAPPEEFTAHAERLPVLALVMTPDLCAEGAVVVARALVDAGARVPRPVADALAPNWCAQEVIDVMRNAALADEENNADAV